MDTQLDTGDVKFWLNKLGYYDGPIDDDYLDQVYRGALKAFQWHSRVRIKTYSGKIDGQYGVKSEAALLPFIKTLEGVPDEFNIKHLYPWFNTYYYIGQARPGNIPVFGKNGEIIANLSPGTYVEAALEGTTKLGDRIINVAGGSYIPVDPDLFAPVYEIIKRNKWLSKPGYGGVSLNSDRTAVAKARRFYDKPVTDNGYPAERLGIPMDPFRTLATDTGNMHSHDPQFKGKGGTVPPGTKVFILEFVGRKLPDGSTHDGWFTANDTGSAIYGAHFDVFTGFRSMAKQFRPWPGRAHIWFEGCEDKLGYKYTFGLQ